MNATKDKKCFIANTVAILLFLFSSPYSLKREPLPADEIEAAAMITSHLFDSALWEIVEPFYHQPISVPHGELDILTLLFPELYSSLPVSEHQLSKYIPWDKKSIAMFFEDWPELLYFKPILDFSMNLPVKSGRVGVFIDRDGVLRESSQRIQFSLEPFSWVSVDGRFSITEHSARWKNRKISITPVEWCSFKAGNVAPRTDRYGLVSGAFGIEKNDENSLMENWLYGDRRSWNTFITDFYTDKLLKKISVESFLHKRKSEDVAGISVNVAVHPDIESQIDFVGMDIKESDDTLMYGIGSIRFRYPVGEVEIALAAPLDLRLPAVPGRFRLNYQREKDRLRIELVYFPEGFFGPLSNLLKNFTESDSMMIPVAQDLLYSQMTWVHQVTPNAVITPSLTLRTSDYLVRYINSGVNVSMKRERFRFIIEYQRFEELWREERGDIDYFKADFVAELFKKNDLKIDFRAKHFSGNNWHTVTVVEQKVELSPEIQIKPGVKYCNSTGTTNQIALSLSYTMTLFKAIYSDCSVEKYISFTKQKGPFRLNAKMWFAF